jgi:NAD(P)-dependent dehydrogenase (short-subunit alcohol dehydrogenase family)
MFSLADDSDGEKYPSRGFQIHSTLLDIAEQPRCCHYSWLQRSWDNDDQIKDYAALSAQKTPAGRTGEPEEIATAVLFLASHDSSFVNAENLVVDGGFSLV